MYLNIGGEEILKKDVIGIFDPDVSTVSARTRSTLRKAEKNGELIVLTDDVPRALVIEAKKNGKEQKLWFSPVSVPTLLSRLKDPY
ncbi:MAG: DUF370 domain-containing protein [Clostridia bacterium]|nr:DUF370 domain-containing protein [Clostridia bacterium]